MQGILFLFLSVKLYLMTFDNSIDSTNNQNTMCRVI